MSLRVLPQASSVRLHPSQVTLENEASVSSEPEIVLLLDAVVADGGDGDGSLCYPGSRDISPPASVVGA